LGGFEVFLGSFQVFFGSMFLDFFLFRVHLWVKNEIRTRLCADSTRGCKNKLESAPARSKTHDDPKLELKLPSLLSTEEHKKPKKNILFFCSEHRINILSNI
jgi:hypothetical protein